MSHLHDLHDLAIRYSAAKQAEDAAIAARRELAAAIQAATGHTAEGQKTYDADGWKIVVKAPLIRSMDWKRWAEIKDEIPAAMQPIKIKEELDEKGVKWLMANEPDLYAVVAQAITTKPGAVQVTVTPVEDE